MPDAFFFYISDACINIGYRQIKEEKKSTEDQNIRKFYKTPDEIRVLGQKDEHVEGQTRFLYVSIFFFKISISKITI